MADPCKVVILSVVIIMLNMVSMMNNKRGILFWIISSWAWSFYQHAILLDQFLCNSKHLKDNIYIYMHITVWYISEHTNNNILDCQMNLNLDWDFMNLSLGWIAQQLSTEESGKFAVPVPGPTPMPESRTAE